MHASQKNKGPSFPVDQFSVNNDPDSASLNNHASPFRTTFLLFVSASTTLADENVSLTGSENIVGRSWSLGSTMAGKNETTANTYPINVTCLSAPDELRNPDPVQTHPKCQTLWLSYYRITILIRGYGYAPHFSLTIEDGAASATITEGCKAKKIFGFVD